MTANVGVIGTSALDPWLVEAMLDPCQDALRIVGVWSPPGLASGGADDRLNQARQARSLDELLALSDCLYVAAPVEQRLAFVQRTIDRNKPVFCEAPLCDSPADSAYLVRGAVNARIAVNYQAPCIPSVALLQTWLKLGALGAPYRLIVSPGCHPWWQSVSPDHVAGRSAADLLMHYLFISRRLFGPMSLRDADVAFPYRLAPGLVPFRAGGLPAVLVGRRTGDPAQQEGVWTVLGVGAARIRGWSALERALPDGSWQSETPEPSNRILRAETAARQVKELAALARGEAHHLATAFEAYEVEAFLDLLRNQSAADPKAFDEPLPIRPSSSRMP